MLPDYPRLKSDVLKKLENTVKQQVRANHGLVDMFRAVYTHEGDRYTYNRVDGSIHDMDSKEHSSKAELAGTDFATYDYNQARELLLRAYGDLHKQMSVTALETIDAVVREAGNVIDGKGGAFTQEIWLEMLEKIETDPDNPDGLRILANPETAIKLRDEMEKWSKDQSFAAKADAVWDRKRRKWLDQESHRKLVD